MKLREYYSIQIPTGITIAVKFPVYNNPQEHIDTETATWIIVNNGEENMLCQMQPTCVNVPFCGRPGKTQIQKI